MISNEIQIKPRKKYLEVPVHKPEKERHEGHKIKKTYSANFSSKRHRHKPTSSDNLNQQKVSEVIIEIPEKDGSMKTCKKVLSKEIQRLNKENDEITAKFIELEDLSVKKILKLKDKVNHLQNINVDTTKDAESVRQQYYDLVRCYDDVRNQLEISKVCKNCEELRECIKKLSEENDMLRNRNKEVTEDLGMLKTVVFRLNVQLERYQDKLRKYNLTIEKSSLSLHNLMSSTSQLKDDEIINILSSDHQNHRHTPISWGSVNTHTLGPLLDAYQDTINEKDEIIQNYEIELSKFTGKLKLIMEENEGLYRKLTEDEHCSSRLEGQLESLKAELKLTKDQNDALIKKCAIKQDKIEEILKIYENKVDQMKRDYNVIHEEYIKLRTENASLKEKVRSLLDTQDDFKNERQNFIPISVHTASVNECKKWYEELKQQYENEKVKLKENIESQIQIIKDLNLTISANKKNKEDFESKIGRFEKEVKKSEAKQLDLEHSLNEVQLSRSACRKQLHKVMCFAKDMVAEQETLLRALNQRQLENRAVKKIGSEMAERMDSLKTQLKDVQKSAWQEFSTVEQKIQEQADVIENMKEEHQKEIEKLEKIISNQEEKLSLQPKDNIPMTHYQLFKDKYK